MTARQRRVAGQQGVAPIIVLLWLSLLATLALAASLITSLAPQTGAAALERVRLRRAAESAVTLALMDLASRLDWAALPGGGAPSPFVDGGLGARQIGQRTLDLLVETWQRICGQPTPCDEPSTTAVTDTRPWGPRNPRWRLLVHVPMTALDPAAGAVCRCYLMAWVADDPADADGDPAADAPAGTPGHGVLLVRGAAFADREGTAEVEALVAQPCRRSGAACAGIRVQSWGAMRDGVP